MAAINFPPSPADGQLFTAFGITWIWSAAKTAWLIVNNGVQGHQGVQGAQGFQGVQGPSGGPQGDPGVQGAQGFQGDVGAQGFQGLDGAQGAQGIQGAQGTDVGLAQANLAFNQANAAYTTANAALTFRLATTGGTITGNLDVTGIVTATNVTSTVLRDTFGSVRTMPLSGSDKTTAYALVANDVGRLVTIGSGGSIVTPATGFFGGDVVSLYNNTSSNVTITTTAVTAYISGNNTTRSTILLYPRGMASILYITNAICVVTGTVI